MSLESPFNKRETVGLVWQGLEWVLNFDNVPNQELFELVELDAPPLAAALYISRLDLEKLVVTAGNRVETYWQLIFTFTALPAGGTKVEASYDRPRKSIITRTWWKNAMAFAVMLPDYLKRQCGFKVLKSETL